MSAPREGPLGGPLTTVLVADDDADTRDLICFKLEQAGYTVRLASNGLEALAQVAVGGIDVAILDVVMPGATGLEICRRLRADPETARVPIMLVSARASGADLRNGFRAGADDYVVKPFSPRDLLNRVEAVVHWGAPLARTG